MRTLLLTLMVFLAVQVQAQNIYKGHKSYYASYSHSGRLFKYATLDGADTNIKSATGDYSTTPVDYKIIPPEGSVYVIFRALIAIQDTNMDAQQYGAMAALTNDVTMSIQSGGEVELDLMDDVPVKSNSAWGRLCYDALLTDFGTGNNFFNVRWTFEKAGTPLYIDGDLGEEFCITLADDFTGLINHYFQLQGYILRRP